MRYTAIRTVNIRKEPRVVQNALGNNREGQLSEGDYREILSMQTNTLGETWGRLTEPDSNGKSLWVCISNINSIFMKPEAQPTAADHWRTAIDTWARAKGYDGPTP